MLIQKYWRYLPSALIAIVFIQSLFFKFTGSYETQYIFSTLGNWLGMQWFVDHGAYLIGSVELLASILLFTPYWAWGSLIAFEVMVSAILFHLFTPLKVQMPVFDDAGQIVGYDGALLFGMACLVAICAVTLIVADWTSEESQIRRVFPSQRSDING